MIRINCTNCKATLDIDEAFAGGVCRCQFCKTIQTVPKHLKSGAVASASTPSPAANGNTFSGDSGSHASGLDELADIVASSGLSQGLPGSGLQNRRNLQGPLKTPRAAVASPVHVDPAKTKLIPMILIIGLAIVLLLGVIIGILINNNSGKSADQKGDVSSIPGNTAVSSNNVPKAVAPTVAKIISGPSIFNTPLTDASIVYVIDRGSSSQPVFDQVIKACLNSINGLSKSQKYRVIFWKIDSEKEALAQSKDLVQAGDKTQFTKLEGDLGMINCYGQSNIRPAMDKAFTSKPNVVVVITAKTLDSEFVKAVMEPRKNNGARVICFSINNPDSRDAMSEVATRTGGSYKNVTREELQAGQR